MNWLCGFRRELGETGAAIAFFLTCAVLGWIAGGAYVATCQ